MKTNSEHIQERRELMDSCQRIVCYRLGISPEDYLSQMYRAMHRYLELRPGFAEWPEVRKAVAESELFATWWKNQWLSRELQFVNSIERGDTREQLTDNWLYLHNPRVLAGCIHPNSVVMERAWPGVIGKVITGVVKGGAVVHETTAHHTLPTGKRVITRKKEEPWN
jgi:hypothetical protein